MTLPPVIRIFFAIDLPETVKEQLGKFIVSLKKKSKSHAIRWTKPDNLHITLQFLAEVRAEHLASLIANVRASIEGAFHNATFGFGAVHLFPNPYRPRVIVLGITPQEPLVTLSSLIGNGLEVTHYAIESRPFRAHLTLGRIKYIKGISLNFLSTCPPLLLEPIQVKEVVLFRSEPHPEGSHYSVLDRILLSNWAH